MTMGIMGGVGLLMCCVALWWAVTAAAAGRLARGGAVGIRTKATTSSDEAWSAGHRAAERPARRLTTVCGVVALAMIVAGVVSGGAEPSPTVIALFVLGYAAMMLGAILIAHTAERAARATQP